MPMDCLEKVEALLLTKSADVQLAVAKQEQAFTSLASKVQQLFLRLWNQISLHQPPSAFTSEPRVGVLERSGGLPPVPHILFHPVCSPAPYLRF